MLITSRSIEISLGICEAHGAGSQSDERVTLTCCISDPCFSLVSLAPGEYEAFNMAHSLPLEM